MAQRGGAKPPRIAVLGGHCVPFCRQLSIIPTRPSVDLRHPEPCACWFIAPSARQLSGVWRMRRSPFSVFFYIGLTLVGPACPARRSQWAFAADIPVVRGLGGRYCGALRGPSLGRHKLAPRLSPNKTWEGAVGSVAGSLLVAGGLLALADMLANGSIRPGFPTREDIWYWLALAVLVNVAAQVGDLAESALKRSVGVKDSGTLASRPRRGSRSHRCAAAGRSGAVVRSGYSPAVLVGFGVCAF